MTRWRVRVIADPGSVDGPLVDLGVVEVEDPEANGAYEQAIAQLWDPRLDTAGCFPHVLTEEIEEEEA